MMDAAKSDPMAAWVLFPASYLQGHAWAPFSCCSGWRASARGWFALEQYAAAAGEDENAIGFAWSRVQHSVASRYDADLWTAVEDEETQSKAGDERAVAALAFDFYHQVRLALSAGGDGEKARLDAAISHLKAFPFKESAVYGATLHDGLQFLMATGRVADARRLRDETPAPPADSPSAWLYEGPPLLQILAEDEAHFAAALTTTGPTSPLLNHLSIATMRRLAARSDTPPLLRAKFARIAWSRTYALGRTVDADLDRSMRRLNPDLTKAWTSRSGRPVKPDDRRALLDVLRSPAINILIVDDDRDDERGYGDRPGMLKIDLENHDDDNWWCAWKRGRNHRALEGMLQSAFFGSADFTLVDANQAYGLRDRLRPALAASFAFRSQDPAEIEALAGIPCAPTKLTGRVLQWVQHPRLFETRQGQAEALALAVKTTRYGCYFDGPHGVYSKAAWTLLHQRFGATDWANRTKYWFNCPLGGKACPAVIDE